MRGDKALTRAKETLKEDQKHQTKLIKTTNRLDYGWRVVTENKTDELVSNSEDGKPVKCIHYNYNTINL